MTRTLLLLPALAAVLGLAQPAGAADGQPPTREQVRAEVLQARAAGRLPPGGETGTWPEAQAQGQPLTRAQVLRELAASGPVPSGEGTDLGQVAPTRSVLSRAEVHAQAVHAVRAGLLPGGEL